MGSDLIHDRGRGPELVGTRITVYSLLPDLMDPARTEADIAADYRVAPAQVAAMRVYVLRHYPEVLAENQRIEERIRRGVEAQNAPEFRARVEAARADFELFKRWVAERKSLGLPSPAELGDWGPAFREWLGAKNPTAAGTA